jgi:hypothetical protein
MRIKLIIHNNIALFFLKTWRDSNPGLDVSEADAMSSATRRQGKFR